MNEEFQAEQYAQLYCLHYMLDKSEIVLNRLAVTIGRDYTCDIVIPKDEISRRHAEISYQAPRYILTDKESTNGTYVNGQKLTQPHLLRNDDLIGLGDIEPLFRFGDPDPTRKVKSHVTFDTVKLIFFWRGQLLDLTPREFRFLHFLYQHKNTVCNRDGCAVAVWGRLYEHGGDDEGLDSIVGNIRRKCRQLDDSVNPHSVIQTRRELGFLLSLD